MLNFEDFKTQAIVWCDNFMKNKFGDAKLHEQKVTKHNCVLTGIACELNDEYGDICPTVYVEELYDKYQQTEDFRGTMQAACEKLIKAMDGRKTILEQTQQHEFILGNIYFSLINTEQNKELLEDIPHRDFMNLSIVYRWMIQFENGEKASAVISNEMMEKIGLDEESLYDLAYENTPKLLGTSVKQMKEFIIDMLEKRGLEDVAELFEQEKTFDNSFYVVSNEYMDKGAINVIFPENIKQIADKFDSNLYLIPISVDEMLVTSTKEDELEMFVELLHENNTRTKVFERLSNEIYLYDRNSQSIAQVTNFGDASLAVESEFTETENTNMGMEMG